MKEISKEELQSINGGFSLLAAVGVVAAGVFLVGVVDGYVRPKKCDE